MTLKVSYGMSFTYVFLEQKGGEKIIITIITGSIVHVLIDFFFRSAVCGWRVTGLVMNSFQVCF